MNFDTEQFNAEVRRAAGRAPVREAVSALYADVQAEIDARRPVCSVSGRCCRFEEFGHRLFVTTLELAAFVHELAARSAAPSAAAAPPHAPHAGSDGPGSPTGGGVAKTSIKKSLPLIDPIAPIASDGVADSAPDPGGCPFQIDRLCSVHAFRPFGCRMFFCDATAADWQNQAYERFHARLKRLHESLGVPYYYLEWRAALRALGLAGPPAGPATRTAFSPSR